MFWYEWDTHAAELFAPLEGWRGVARTLLQCAEETALTAERSEDVHVPLTGVSITKYEGFGHDN